MTNNEAKHQSEPQAAQPGPQRGPASVPQIEAQAKSARQRIADLPGEQSLMGVATADQPTRTSDEAELELRRVLATHSESIVREACRIFGSVRLDVEPESAERRLEVACPGGVWTVTLAGQRLQICDPSGRCAHSSHGHQSTGVHLAMVLDELRRHAAEVEPDSVEPEVALPPLPSSKCQGHVVQSSVRPPFEIELNEADMETARETERLRSLLESQKCPECGRHRPHCDCLTAEREAREKSERDCECAIKDRDEAEEALGKIYREVTGKEAAWSSNFGYSECIDLVEQAVWAKEQELGRHIQAREAAAKAFAEAQAEAQEQEHRAITWQRRAEQAERERDAAIAEISAWATKAGYVEAALKAANDKLAEAERERDELRREVIAAHEELDKLPTKPFKSVDLRSLSLPERIANVCGMWDNDLCELDAENAKLTEAERELAKLRNEIANRPEVAWGPKQ